MMNRCLMVGRVCGAVVAIWLMAGVMAFGGVGEDAAMGVIRRTVGEGPARHVRVKIKADDSALPSYAYTARDGELVISGNSPVAVCRGFYDYLRANGIGMVGWRGAVVRVPQRWPDAPLTKGQSPYKFNQMYNVVTAGYSFPYWDWKRWRHELDWLALHGYNMIMAPIGTESIQQRVWLKLGLSQSEIDAFNCGPAHMPWQRMGNICHTDGPLPQAWLDDQVELQHKILKRMRELGIEPIVQAFAGFVPHAVRSHYPDEKYFVSHWNGGFRNERAPIYLLPESKLFKKIFRLYINEWQKEFGDARYYLVDTFNEIRELPSKPGMTTEQVMAEYGGNLIKQLRAVDADAVWVIQGWIFGYQRHIWQPSVVKALFSRVPNDRLLILDMIAQWKDFDGYYGKPWIYGFITNMGGRTPWAGKLDEYVNAPAQMLKSPKRNNNVGMSNQSEGTEVNDIIFELIADVGWSADKINLDEWLKKYCLNRYGKCTPEMLKIYQTFRNTAYKNKGWGTNFHWQLCAAGGCRRLYSLRFIKAVQQFLSMGDLYKDSPFYQDDAVALAAFVLCQYADINRSAAFGALSGGDHEAYERSLGLAVKELLQADRLLESHSIYRLERWQKFAASHKGNEQERNFYQENARRIITSWGPPVNNYSARIWSGLIRDFYVPRMKAYLGSREHHTHFDFNKWEDKWIHSLKISRIEPYPDPVEKAAQFIEEAIIDTKKNMKLPKNVLAIWGPDQMSTEWITVDWPISGDVLKKLKGVKFVFTYGSHRIRVKSVEIVADGKVVASDRHEGLAGDKHVNNIYRFDIPKDTAANNSCLLRVVLRSEGGTDSNGKIEIIK